MSKTSNKNYVLFDRNTKAFVYGYQTNAIQRMLDFDYVCNRPGPSISAIIIPTGPAFIKSFGEAKRSPCPCTGPSP